MAHSHYQPLNGPCFLCPPRVRWRILSFALAIALVWGFGTAALAHYDYGFRVVGPNECELEWASNHTSTQYSAETVESSRSSAQNGCKGVSGKVRYKLGTAWTTRYESDTTFPYDVFLNGSHNNGYDYSDHNGWNRQNSVWYGFRNDH